MDRIEYLSFLLEGDYNAYLDENDIPLEVPDTTWVETVTKSYLAPVSFRKRGDTIQSKK